MTPANYLLRLRDDNASDSLLFTQQLATQTPGVREALGSLNGIGVTETRMTEIVQEIDGDACVPGLFYGLTRLQQAGQLEYVLPLADGTGVRVVPLEPVPVFLNVRFDATRIYRLSRFTFMRPDRGAMQIESALRPAVVRFSSPLPGALLTMLGQPASCDSITAILAGPAADIAALMELFVVVGFLEEAEAPEPPSLVHWDFHELLFHVRSSAPRMGELFGGMDPHRQPEPPSIKPAFQGTETIVLTPPRLKEWMAEDPPLARVIEDRRSAATPGPSRPTLTQVGDFLYRTAHPQGDALRALPSAGARHELEFYVAVHDADGLKPGFYHYHALSHRLDQLNTADDLVAELLRRAAGVWATKRNTPHLLIVVASRFPRMASRYAAIAYRNTLLDSGIAIEAMYLNATAMGLAPCALGINLPHLFARITRLDPIDETSVAMFALSA